SCFVLADNLERRDVEVLHTETDRVLVRGLLQAGDRVVTEGIQRLVPGQSAQSIP
ncbi:efflux transporter periplasmic adaptor subunit, partial [Leptolyngbya sp. FACHB-671]|nr:efflux transporter periplasmic adaptor subunit [Leptolyngbya sp. FACHB-671]